MAIAAYAWVDALHDGAPDVVAAWRGIEEGRFISVGREVRMRAGAGTAERRSLSSRRSPTLCRTW
jgi:hypothetical protein